MATELLQPDHLPDLIESPEFSGLTFPERQKVFEQGVSESAEWVSKNGGWTPETFTGFRESVQALRGKVGESESTGEWWAGAGRKVGTVIKDSAATLGTTALDSFMSNPTIQAAQTAITGEPMRAPMSDVVGALDRNMGKLADSSKTAWGKTMGQADEDIDAQLSALDASIGKGEFLGNPKEWIKGQADAMEQKVRGYYTQQGTAPESEAEYLSSNRLDSKANLPLVLHYLSTGDPKARTALREKLLTLPHRAKMEQLDESATKDSETGRTLDRIFGEGTSRYVSEAGDPLELAGNLLSFFGGKAATTAVKAAMKGGTTQALKGAGKLALGGTAETASEMGSLFMDNPDATAAQYAQTAKDAAIGSFGLAGLGAGYQVVSDHLATPQNAEMPVAATAPTIPGQEGATDAEFAAQDSASVTGANATDAGSTPAAGTSTPGVLSQIAASAGRAVPAVESQTLPTEDQTAPQIQSPQEVQEDSATSVEQPAPEPAPVKFRTFDERGRLKAEKELPHAEAMKELRGRESMLQKLFDCLGRKLA